MNVADTLIWLLNFPASHAYAMVFIAGFSILGLFAASSRGAIPGAALRIVRESEGLVADEPRRSESILGRARRLVFRVLAIVMLVNLVVGILSLTGVPLTRAYIHENGIPTTATLDGDWVTFSTTAGVEYTLESNFFSPAVYPDRDAYFPSGDPVVVRYLPDHPQAFVIDSTQTPR